VRVCTTTRRQGWHFAHTRAWENTTIALIALEGTATLEADAAARVLLLWVRPGDPSRI